MNRTERRMLRSIFVILVVVGCAGDCVVQAQIFKDDFESGVDGNQIPNTGPWRINDSGPVAEGLTARYRTQNNPFSSGLMYAHLNDPQNATGYGFRFLSTNAADPDGYAAQINDQVTTFSFEFYETLPDNAPTQPGMVFGYYYNQPTTGMAPDMNSAGRIYVSFLHNGMLNPSTLVPESGSPVAYAQETVHTVYMVANDSAAAVENYRDGRTVAPGQADVWISLAGADPVFAFSVSNPNVGIPERIPGGVGFRAFTADIEEFYINNVLLVDGASFDRSAFDTPPGVLGDYNGNGTVDAADYVLWRNGGPLQNDPTPQTVGPEDYTYWVSRFGATTNPTGSGGGGALVPEPSAIVLALGMMVFVGRRERRS